VTVIQATAGGPLACQLESIRVDIDAGETDSGISGGEDVAGQAGAAADITAGCPFMGCRDTVYRGATGQVVDMRFRMEAGWVGDRNLWILRKQD